MIKLRPYQIQSIHLLRESFKKHKRILLVLPTGAGKTIVFSEMVKLAYQKGTQTIIATDRIELFTQTLNAIAFHNINPQIVNANTKSFYKDAPVTICMVETIMRRIKKWKEIDYSPKLIIIDEAHKGNFFKLIDTFPTASVIGATATPINKKMHLYYTDIINNIGVGELIDLGYLCRAKSFQMQDSFDDIPIYKGEFAEKQLFQHFDRKKLYDGCVQKYIEKTPNKKALVFCVNVAHTEKMNDEFNLAGIKSFCITSKTHIEERKRILSDFSDGKFNVLVNCGCLTAGVDIPSIQTIIMNRATLSVALFLQCIGRGSRPTETKKEFIILDFGMNFTRHGLYDEERKWSLEPPKKKKKGIAPIKECPRCSAMLQARAIKCEFCGYIFITDNKSVLKNGVLVEVGNNKNEFEGRKISELSLKELVQLSKTKKIKTPYIWRVVRAKGYDAVQNYGWLMGYKNGWAFNQQKELNDCSFRDRIL